jgi:hypothetical protein
MYCKIALINGVVESGELISEMQDNKIEYPLRIKKNEVILIVPRKSVVCIQISESRTKEDSLRKFLRGHS